MGNVCFGRRGFTNNEINISDCCLDRVLEGGKTIKELREMELYTYIPPDENFEIKKLRQIDEDHSNRFNLTPEKFDAMADELLHKHKTTSTVCEVKRLMYCLKMNPDCALRCKHMLDAYIDCVDAKRIGKIREKVLAEEKQKKKLETRKLLKELCGDD